MTRTNYELVREKLAGDFDYSALMDCVRILGESFEFLSFNYLTESLCKRAIPMLGFGEGEKEFYYIGTHHGAERICGALLVRFILDMCRQYESRSCPYGINLEYIFKSRSLYFVPMLNTDGAEISAHGARAVEVAALCAGKAENLAKDAECDGLAKDRLVAMNGGSDFTLWQANARGVDLNHNYDAGFAEYKELERSLGIFGGASTKYSGEAPESEPETGALCNFLRFNNPTALVTLHTQGREIYYTSGEKCPVGSKSAAMRFAALTGYKTAEPSGTAAYGGLTDFCIQKLGIPAFTFECGMGKNPLPPKALPEIYEEMRRALFTFPTMF